MSTTMTGFAASRPINPPGVTPVLTQAQVWKGLGIKAREPKTFVPMISSCEVVIDEGNKIVRKVSFNGGPEVTENIELHGATIAYFEMESTGIRITNIVSYDVSGDLILAFSFANGIPGGSEGKTALDLNATVGKGVEHSIARIRQLVVNGVI